MKSTENFKKVIEDYLLKQASIDSSFQLKMQNPLKNLDDCITYVLNTVQQSKCNGFTDEEIFNMAMHYYDEADIKVGDKVDMQVIINHKVQLTAEEIAKTKEQAIKDVILEQQKKILNKTVASSAPTKKETTDQTLSLF